jgi:hypothetical protein
VAAIDADHANRALKTKYLNVFNLPKMPFAPIHPLNSTAIITDLKSLAADGLQIFSTMHTVQSTMPPTERVEQSTVLLCGGSQIRYVLSSMRPEVETRLFLQREAFQSNVMPN